MREILHALALAVVVAVAALCTLVQLSDVDHAVDQLGRDEQSVIRQVSSDTGSGQAGTHRQHAAKDRGQAGVARAR